MLSDADKDVVKRSALPGLAILLDPEQFLVAVQTSMPHLEAQSTGLPTRTNYDLRSCRVLYNVKCSDGPKQLWGIAFRFEDFGNVALTPRTGNPADRGVLADRAVLLGMLPDDLEIDLFPLLGFRHDRRNYLSALIPSHPSLWDADLRIIRYIPQQRLVAQLGEPPDAAHIKIYAAKGFPRWQCNSIVSRGNLRVAHCLGTSARHRAIAFEWLQGYTLKEALKVDAGFDANIFGEAGMALAELHKQNVTGLKPTRRWTVERVQDYMEQVSLLLPGLTRRANDVLRRLSQFMRTPLNPICTIHGDFSADNVFLTKDCVAIIDFDAAARGDPAMDLGNAIGGLERGSALGHTSPSITEGAMEALVAGYRYAMGGSLPICAAIYAAVFFCRSMSKPFRARLPNWPDVTETLLSQAEAFIRQAEAEASKSRCKYSQSM